MKSRILATSFSLALLTATAALGQSSAVSEANIPFEFHVGTMILPPGQYRIGPEVSHRVLRIRGTKAQAFAMTRGVEAKETPGTGSLLFTRYGNAYFLSQVRAAGSPLIRELPKSKAERELARSSAPEQRREIVLARR